MNPVKMPTWFIPHGAGPCFFMDWSPPDTWSAMEDFLRKLPNTLPERPRGIVMISAHWVEEVVQVTSGIQPKLIYDYAGFPEHTYALQYPAKGDPELANRIVSLLNAQEISAKLNPVRGFDHGMFIPLMLMFPDADIPVVQVSLQSNLNPQKHLEIGAAIAGLRNEGILIIGSGMSFHHMRGYGDPRYTPISEQFDQWLSHTIESPPDIRSQGLANWERAPSARQCHPDQEEEHLLPLMVVAGAADMDQGKRVFTDRVLETTISAYFFSSFE